MGGLDAGTRPGVLWQWQPQHQGTGSRDVIKRSCRRVSTGVPNMVQGIDISNMAQVHGVMAGARGRRSEFLCRGVGSVWVITRLGGPLRVPLSRLFARHCGPLRKRLGPQPAVGRLPQKRRTHRPRALVGPSVGNEARRQPPGFLGSLSRPPPSRILWPLRSAKNGISRTSMIPPIFFLSPSVCV